MTNHGLIFGRFVVSPTLKKREEHHNSNNRSSGTLVLPSPVQFPTPSPYSNSDTRRSGGCGRRFSEMVGEYMRSFFHLPRHALTTTTMGEIRTREMVTEKRPLGTETIEQREEIIIVRDDSVPYVVSQPIPEGKTLREVAITIISKDKGWSSYLGDYGTYRNSWTWFELSLESDSGEKWRSLVVKNLHAHDRFKEHTIEILDGELYEKSRSGDVLIVWALAKFQGWENMVERVTIRYVVE